MDDRPTTVVVTPRAPADRRGDGPPGAHEDDAITRLSAPTVVSGPTVIRPRPPPDDHRDDATTTVWSGPTAVRAPTPPPRERQTIASALPDGYRLHEYRIDSVLGQGGFGITYLATDINLHAAVAIKEYLPNQLAVRMTDSTVCPRFDQHAPLLREGLEHFLAEARTLATFRHPNIVRVARFFEANRTAYMVLDYERGRSLGDWWRSLRRDNTGLKRLLGGRQGAAAVAGGTLAEQDLVLLLSPLLDGLAVVHRSGVLHRDIKPDNLYVRDEDGSLVLLDFGAARQTTAAGPNALDMLTPGFAPIEQHHDGQQGPWTDLYALGATLYWMVAGERPREAPKRLVDPLGEPSAEQAGAGRYSVEFLRAIDWALQIDPKDRPQSVAEFRRALFAAHATSLGLTEALAADTAAGAEGPTARAWRCRGVRRLLRPRSWPIAVKMTLILALVAVLPMSLTGYHSYVKSVIALAAAERGGLEHLALATAGRIAQILEDSQRVAAYLANDGAVTAVLVSPTQSAKAALHNRFAGLVAANPDVHLLTLMDAQGTAIVSTAPEVVGGNYGFRDYFKTAMAGQPNVTGIIVGAVMGRAGAYVAHPVRPNGGPVAGVVALRLRAEAIDHLVETAGGDNRTPFLIDGDGVLIYHPDAARRFSSLATLSSPSLAAILADQRFRRDRIASLDMPTLAAAMIGARQAGTIDYPSTISRAAEVAGFAPVAGHDWVVGVTETRESFEAPLRLMFRQVLVGLLVVGLVSMVLALLFAHSIVRPIRQLTAAADALRHGDYDDAYVRVVSQDEVGALGRTFNVMIDVLRQRERERRLHPPDETKGAESGDG